MIWPFLEHMSLANVHVAWQYNYCPLSVSPTAILLAHFSPGVVPVFLEGVQCSGTESNLTECILENTVGGDGVCPRHAGVKCERKYQQLPPDMTSHLVSCFLFQHPVLVRSLTVLSLTLV